MADRLAFVISAAASPFITITASALAVIVTHTPSAAEFLRYAVPFLALTILLPGVWIWVGVRLGRYTDPHVMMREQRLEPFLVANAGAAAVVGAYMLMGASNVLMAVAVNMLVNGLLFMVITRFWKVSIHSAGYAASVVTAAILVYPSFGWLGLGFPMVVWARLRRQRHSAAQALVAAALVTGSTLAVLSLYGAARFR